MEILTELKRSEKPTSTALGYFDGLHKGHQAVIREAVENGKNNSLVPTVFTLLQSPRTVLRGEESRNIITSWNALFRLPSISNGNFRRSMRSTWN